jgi:hypothetical protein
MRIAQREVRLRVVKIGFLKADLIVTFGAVLAEFALMDVLLFMATKTVGRRFSKLLAGGMAARACDRLVPTFQLVTADGMFE